MQKYNYIQANLCFSVNLKQFVFELPRKWGEMRKFPKKRSNFQKDFSKIDTLETTFDDDDDDDDVVRNSTQHRADQDEPHCSEKLEFPNKSFPMVPRAATLNDALASGVEDISSSFAEQQNTYDSKNSSKQLHFPRKHRNKREVDDMFQNDIHTRESRENASYPASQEDGYSISLSNITVEVGMSVQMSRPHQVVSEEHNLKASRKHSKGRQVRD